MIVKNKYFIVSLSMLLLVGNSKAGWKKDKESSTTTTTTSATISVSMNVQSTTTASRNVTTVRKLTFVPIVNTEAAIIDDANLKLNIGVDTIRETIQNNVRFNPRTNFSTNIIVSRSNKSGIDHGDSQSSRNLTVDLIGTKESLENQPLKIFQESSNSDDSVSSAYQNKPSTFSSPNGKTWADIAAVGTKSASLAYFSRQPEYSMHPLSGNETFSTSPRYIARGNWDVHGLLITSPKNAKGQIRKIQQK